MNRRRAVFVLALAAASVAGCATATSQGSAGGNSGTRLTADDLAKANSDNIYDAIAKLRPQWLTSRGPTSVSNSTPTAVDVFMNGNIVGTVDYLREVRLLDVSEVRYWDAGQASARFGMGHPRGVIEITRR